MEEGLVGCFGALLPSWFRKMRSRLMRSKLWALSDEKMALAGEQGQTRIRLTGNVADEAHVG
jgi:hypothetical protein